MSMENIIKEKTEEIVEKYRKSMESAGMPFPNLYEDLLRQGISYGISFAAMALVSIPSDITFATTDIEKKEKKLPSYDEYKKGPHSHHLCGISGSKYSEPLFKCPVCGGEVRRDESIVLTTIPPKCKYKCDICGKVFHF